MANSLPSPDELDGTEWTIWSWIASLVYTALICFGIYAAIQAFTPAGF
jgi:hypothetical protein